MIPESGSSPSRWLVVALVVVALVGFYRLAHVHHASDAPTPGAAPSTPSTRPAQTVDMVTIAAGEFFAGCNESVDHECFDLEKPGGTRTLPAFSIDRTEVTVAAYRACVDAGACREADGGEGCNASLVEREAHPINCVDWEQARAYCTWRGARLPSEWEWERAARGTDGRKYPWGNEPVDCRRAVIDEGSGSACGRGDTTFEVGSKPEGASPDGVLDLIGNVWEWTASIHDGNSSPVVRGGAYYVDALLARASFQLRFSPVGSGPFVGFRCAKSFDEPIPGNAP